MVPGDGERPFGPDEWSACLKVLEALGEQPEAAPDRERIERLVARLYRKTRRGRRKAGAEARRQEDRDLVERTGRVLAASDRTGRTSDRADAPPDRRAAESEVTPLLHLQGPISGGPPPLPSALPALRPAQRGEAPPAGRPVRAAGDRHRRADQDRLSGRPEAAPGRGRGPGHDPLPQGGRPPLRPRARLRRLGGPAADRTARLPLPAGGRGVHRRLAVRAPRLDILINNAAQTVRRTPDYFAEAEALERMPLEALPGEPPSLLRVDPLPGSSAGAEVPRACSTPIGGIARGPPPSS